MLAMPPSPFHRIDPIDQMTAEWLSLGRSAAAVRALHLVADRDQSVALLVRGSGTTQPLCRTPVDLVDHMRRASGRTRREGAAALIRVLLREAPVDPLVSRMLMQALLPGLVSVAQKLRWGQGGDWEDGSEFFSELLSTAWLVLDDWSGQDRPYAVLDLLSAIRCRLRRQLFRAKELRQRAAPLTADVLATQAVRPETDLEELSRILIELCRQGMRTEEVQVLYAHHVLGFSIAELATVTGRDRRSLYARRDRGQRRLCA
jgi:DNA-directed RNA polymerase specialized sigma24 family protein